MATRDPTTGRYVAEVSISANLKGLVSGLKKGIGHLQSFANRVGTSINVATKHLSRLGLAAGGAAVALGKLGVDFQSQMATVSTMLTGPAEKLLPKLSEGVEKLSAKFGESTDTLSKGLYDILSAGIDASKALDVLETSAVAAVAGVSDTGVAADALTTIMNSFKLRAQDAMSVADLLFAIVARGKTTFNEIGAKIGMVAANAATAGQSLEDMGATLATMTRNGIKTDQAVTSLAGILRVFAGATDAQKKEAAKFNIELSTAWLRANGLGRVLQRLKGQSPEVVKAIFQESEAVKGLSAMLQDAKGYSDDLETMKGRAGSAMAAFGKQAKTVAFKMKQAWQSLVGIGRKVGTALLEPISKLLDKYRPELDKWSKSTAAWLSRNGSSFDDAIWGFADGFKKGVMPALKRVDKIVRPTLEWLGISLKKTTGDLSKLTAEEKRLEEQLADLKSGELIVLGGDQKKVIADTEKALEAVRGKKAAKGAASLGNTLGNIAGVLIQIQGVLLITKNPILSIAEAIRRILDFWGILPKEAPASAKALSDASTLMGDVWQKTKPDVKEGKAALVAYMRELMNTWQAERARMSTLRTLLTPLGFPARLIAPEVFEFAEVDADKAISEVMAILEQALAGKKINLDKLPKELEAAFSRIMPLLNAATSDVAEQIRDLELDEDLAAWDRGEGKPVKVRLLFEKPEEVINKGKKVGELLTKGVTDAMLKGAGADVAAAKQAQRVHDAAHAIGRVIGEVAEAAQKRITSDVSNGITKMADDLRRRGEKNAEAVGAKLKKSLTSGLTPLKNAMPEKAFNRATDRAMQTLQKRIDALMSRLPKSERANVKEALGKGIALDTPVSEDVPAKTRMALERTRQAILAWLSRLNPAVASKLKDAFTKGVDFKKRASPSIQDVLTTTLSSVKSAVENVAKPVRNAIHGAFNDGVDFDYETKGSQSVRDALKDTLDAIEERVSASASRIRNMLHEAFSAGVDATTKGSPSVLDVLGGTISTIGGAVSSLSAALTTDLHRPMVAAAAASNVSNVSTTNLAINAAMLDARFVRTVLVPELQRAQQMGVYR